MILPASDEAIAAAAEALARGELIGMPTETVYGLAANAWDAAAVRKIFEAKSRPATNPLIVHLPSYDRLGEVIRRPPEPIVARQLDALCDLWPGPLTVVCPAGDRVPSAVTAGKPTVAVRVPAHPVAQRLLAACSFPVAAPSANRSGYVSPTLPQHVCDASGLGRFVSLVIDGGPCIHGVESTIVLLGERPRLLRPGSITAEELARRLGVEPNELATTISTSVSAEELLAPGMMREHYAPRTPLILLRAAETDEPGEDTPANVGRIAFRRLCEKEAARYRLVETLSESADLVEVARNLFAALRRLDTAGLEAIHCDTCPAVGLGQAIMDRLSRAAR